MQPQATKTFDEKSFSDFREIIKKTFDDERKRKSDPQYVSKFPYEISIQLTHQCNLRCKHCFQWSPIGHHHHDVVKELDFSVIEKVVEETNESKSALYLWGGETFMYSHWGKVAKLIEKNPRRTVISTNGLLIEKYIETLLPISENLVVIISIDGLEDEHDMIRGKGCFKRLQKNIHLLADLKKHGLYKGRIVLNCSLHEALVPKLFDFVEFCERQNADRLVIGFPWFINDETLSIMDTYFKKQFSWIDNKGCETPSWYSYKHKIDLEMVSMLKNQINRINSRVWKTRVGYHPIMDNLNEIEQVLKGHDLNHGVRKHCLGLSSRISIFADGNVSFCTNFPEFSIGNIYDSGLMEIWRGEAFRKLRTIRNTELMPVSLCQRCRLLSFNPQ